jgi:uncharacterized protein (DUF488 family)
MISAEYEPPDASGAIGCFLDKCQIFTIGHSNHSHEKFVGLLQQAQVGLLIDVRRHPGSRHVPWTSSETLGKLLLESSIDYAHLPDLGGRRRPSKSKLSPNDGWRNAQFRGYADHMSSPEFAHSLAQLEAKARYGTAAMMCAEAQWWRCHRRLVSDALVVRGWRVVHLGSRGEQVDHVVTDFAVVEGGQLFYPSAGKNSARTDADQGMTPVSRSPNRALGAEA